MIRLGYDAPRAPLACAVQATETVTPAAGATSTRPAGRVLVADDDRQIREFVRVALEDEGYEVLTAADGASALALALAAPPDVILLDLNMPVMDGWRFAAAYRGAAGRAPIVVLTAAADAARRRHEIGAVAWLGKPFDLDELLRVVGCVITPAGR
jgi:DNA-binding response OmpR family regulator